MKQQFLNDSGLTELIGYIKKYVKDEQDVKPYASLSVFPKTGEQNIIYIDTTVNASYYWDDTSKTYKALDVQTWANLTGKPSTFPPSSHTHDDRYYTETEINTKLAAKANSSHKHVKADITDFPTSMPASDVPAWAKASTKPTYTKAEVGLGNVDNTADKDKSVKYATSAGSASTAGSATTATTATMATKLQTYKQGSTTETYGTQYPLYAQWEDSSNARLKVDNYTVKVNYADKAGSATSASSATVADSAKSVAWGNVTGKPSTFTPSTHTHTKSEVGLGNVDNTADANKSVKYAVSAGTATTATTASSANAVAWGNVTGKPSTYPASSHTHDDRYYTEGEINTLLDVKAVNKVLTNEDLNTITTPGFYSASGGNTVTNKPSDIDNFGLIVIHKASGSYYTQILFYDTVSYRRICANGTWGSWTQDKLTDTNTWRGIQNNLTSDSTTDSLSAAQGKALKTLVDGKSALGHKHTKSEITNFPTSMPASDVYSWAKASTKPAYSWSEINNKPSTFTPSSHTHGSGDITSLSADKITGVIGIDHLPAGALERCKIVANDTARFKLTTSDVQNGDVVKVGTDANAKMYFVIDETKLSSEDGYTVFSAGTATSVPWSGVTGKPSTFTPSAHTHDDRYYTESEINTKLDSKSNTGHTHDDRYYTKTEMNTKLTGKSDTSHSHNLSTMINTLTEGTAAPTDDDYYIAQYAGGGTTTITYHRRLHSALWSYIKGKADSVYQVKGSYAASSHTHTIAQVSNLQTILDSKASASHTHTIANVTGLQSALDGKAASVHTHSYAGSSSAGGSANSAVKLDTTSAGSATQPVYFSGGKPVATTYTLGASVPAGAKFTDTNTWRPLGTTADTACAGNDSRLSNARPASDVYSWAKASSKPSYSWGEISGKPSTFTPSSHSHSNLTSLGNVTAEKDKTSQSTSGLSMQQAYDNGYPTTYGNVINLNGTGQGQILVSWAGNSSTSASAMYFRGKTDNNAGNWSDWRTVLDSSNYTSYTVTKTGLGASGTWGINVTGSAGSVAWGNVSGRPSSMPASDVYSWAKASSKPSYSWSEISGRPSSLPANGGNASTVNGHTVNANVPAGAVFTDTNTWRPVVNNLTSTSTDQSLSAAQGKILKDKLDKLIPIGYIFIWNNRKLTNFNETLSGAPALTSAQAVHDYFGFGTWQQVSDTFLYGNPNSQGGASTVSLGVGNMPSHTHSIPALSGWAASNGAHTHNVRAKYTNNCATKSGGSARANGGGDNTSDWRFGDTDSQGAHGHNVSTNASTTGSNGSGSAFSIMPPYKGVYIWQRIA